MFARVSRIEGSPGQVDAGIEYFRQVRAPLQQHPGFKHAYLFVNRQSGEMLTITLWENEADLQAGALIGDVLRRQGADRAGAPGGPVSVEVYEVALRI